MSYCNISESSNVYMYPHISGYINCMCHKHNKHIKTRKGAILHLYIHRLFGDRVPDLAFEILRNEIKKYGNKVNKDDY